MRFTDFIKLLLLITNALFYLNIAICIAFIFVSATGGYDDILSDILQYKETSSGSLGEVNSERVGIVLQVIFWCYVQYCGICIFFYYDSK